MKLRDVDSAETVFRMRAAAYAAMVGGLAALGGAIVSAYSGKVPIWAGLVAGIPAAALVYFVSLYLAERGASVGASIYQPSGSSTPPLREYSLADSLVARGRIDEAAEAYQVLSEDFPHDPEPRLRHARLLRDKSSRYEEAAQILKRTLTIPTLKPETELVVLRELVELCTHKLREPTRALPYLARITQKFAGTPTGDWARAESLDIKQQMQQDHDRNPG